MPASLLIHHEPSGSDLLAEWRWKIGGGDKIVALSVAGDAFVRQADGQVWWLETGAGAFVAVAPSEAAFYQLLENPKEASRLLLAPVVEQFAQLNGPIPADRCLGFKQYPVLGGTYTVENRWLSPIVEHFGITGDLHRQIRDLPEGAKVRIDVVK